MLLDALRYGLLGAYVFVLAMLVLYGIHRYYLVYLYYRYRHRRPRPAGRFNDLPTVTVQLPVYNERYVVERLIDAICRLDYPRDRLEIQVLDDSTDDTSEIARRTVARQRARGIDIVYHHRSDRRGFKAGALEEGLRFAKGEFVAIFDADFIPPPDILQRGLEHFEDDGVAAVQGYQDHVLNWDETPVTRVVRVSTISGYLVDFYARSLLGTLKQLTGFEQRATAHALMETTARPLRFVSRKFRPIPWDSFYTFLNFRSPSRDIFTTLTPLTSRVWNAARSSPMA